MMNNKKSMLGYEYIIMFFFFLVAFLFVILITDVGKVEFFEPMHDRMLNMTQNISSNSSVYYTKSQDIWDTAEGITLPYNLILIFVTAYLILVSIIDAGKQDKKNIYSLLFGTLGGIIFIIYFIHLFLIGILEYFEVEVISYLFADLITSNVPFYNYLLDIWGIFILLWVLSMALSNNLFGKEVAE